MPVLHWLLSHVAAGTLDAIRQAFRKRGHISEYFIFSLLLLRTLRASRRVWTLRWAVIALLIAAGYSGLDEWHQSFAPSRGPSP